MIGWCVARVQEALYARARAVGCVLCGLCAVLCVVRLVCLCGLCVARVRAAVQTVPSVHVCRCVCTWHAVHMHMHMQVHHAHTYATVCCGVVRQCKTFSYGKVVVTDRAVASGGEGRG